MPRRITLQDHVCSFCGARAPARKRYIAVFMSAPTDGRLLPEQRAVRPRVGVCDRCLFGMLRVLLASRGGVGVEGAAHCHACGTEEAPLYRSRRASLCRGCVEAGLEAALEPLLLVMGWEHLASRGPSEDGARPMRDWMERGPDPETWSAVERLLLGEGEHFTELAVPPSEPLCALCGAEPGSRPMRRFEPALQGEESAEPSGAQLAVCAPCAKEALPDAVVAAEPDAPEDFALRCHVCGERGGEGRPLYRGALVAVCRPCLEATAGL